MQDPQPTKESVLLFKFKGMLDELVVLFKKNNVPFLFTAKSCLINAYCDCVGGFFAPYNEKIINILTQNSPSSVFLIVTLIIVVILSFDDMMIVVVVLVMMMFIIMIMIVIKYNMGRA